MEELKQILQIHAYRYPKMEPSDAVKLIYQNEFGGGHLSLDERACLTFLRSEYAALDVSHAVPETVEIGNGLIRVDLRALSAGELEQLGQAFLQSARDHTGSMEQFYQKLGVLRQLTAQGIFAFDLRTLDDYLRGYYEAGSPMVSHSATYRRAYHPAYRIVRKEYWQSPK